MAVVDDEPSVVDSPTNLGDRVLRLLMGGVDDMTLEQPQVLESVVHRTDGRRVQKICLSRTADGSAAGDVTSRAQDHIVKLAGARSDSALEVRQEPGANDAVDDHVVTACRVASGRRPDHLDDDGILTVTLCQERTGSR